MQFYYLLQLYFTDLSNLAVNMFPNPSLHFFTTGFAPSRSSPWKPESYLPLICEKNIFLVFFAFFNIMLRNTVITISKVFVYCSCSSYNFHWSLKSFPTEFPIIEIWQKLDKSVSFVTEYPCPGSIDFVFKSRMSAAPSSPITTILLLLNSTIYNHNNIV